MFKTQSLITFRSIDATVDNNSFGRLVNDTKTASNCKVRTILVDGVPHLVFFATNEGIRPGEENMYDYGGTDYPWRMQVSVSLIKVS